MTSPFYISLTAKTARLGDAGFGVQAGGVDSRRLGMWGDARPRTAIVDAVRNLDALAARSAG
jgi:hypothetical protein